MKSPSRQLGAALLLLGFASPTARIPAQADAPVTISTEHPELLQQTTIDAYSPS